MARQSTNPALTRIPAFSGRGQAGDRSFPPPTTPPSGAGPQPYGSTGIDFTKRSDVGFDRQQTRPDRAMTVDDVIMRTGIMIGTVFVFAALTWVSGLVALAFPAALVGFGLAIFITLKQVTNPVAILAYAAVEGVFVGGFSKLIAGYVGNGNGDGNAIVVQALVGTAGVAALMLFLYKSGRIRVTPQFQKMVIMATLGFVVLIMANLVFSLFTGGAGLRGGFLGIIVGVVAIGLASMNLVLDFDLIDKAAKQGVPERYGWLAAFGLVVTLVWLYVEILRLLALLTGRD